MSSNAESTSQRYTRSIAAHERRSRVIAGGVNSNVRLMSRPVPLTFTRAHGAMIWDIDGNEYIDYAAGMGPTILGHNHPRVLAAVQQALQSGQCFAGQHELEAEFAERLIGAVPWIENIRIGLAGSDMDLLAVRIAKAVTGRSKVLRFTGHYHGWIDPLLVGPGAAPTPFGTPPVGPGQSVAAASEIVMCEWNDVSLVEQVFATHQIACVIMEPIMCNTGVIAAQPGYIEAVKALCKQHGAVLVIDEVITGFRVGLQGAQGHLGITGDITLYAKAIASGYPMAAIGTSRELMAGVGRGEVNHSGTYNSGYLSVAAAVETMKILVEENPYPSLQKNTVRLVEGLRKVGNSKGLAVDYVAGSLFQVRFGAQEPMQNREHFAKNSDQPKLLKFLDALQDRGVRPTSRGLFFVSVAHDDRLIDRTLEIAESALASL
ncbi:glutamate-1-semialdehyde 2,1-aminomutase [Actinomycetes bacterium]|nr:glutamate-1-semialdehyde 2,1-aminomutase [Actinomycetes bacterium]